MIGFGGYIHIPHVLRHGSSGSFIFYVSAIKPYIYNSYFRRSTTIGINIQSSHGLSSILFIFRFNHCVIGFQIKFYNIQASLLFFTDHFFDLHITFRVSHNAVADNKSHIHCSITFNIDANFAFNITAHSIFTSFLACSFYITINYRCKTFNNLCITVCRLQKHTGRACQADGPAYCSRDAFFHHVF